MSEEKPQAQPIELKENTRGFTLKPLRGVPSESGYYGYSGKPFTNADVKALRDKGVVFAAHPNGDLMPDGVRLKHPKYRSDFRNNANNMRKVMAAEPRLADLTEFDAQFEQWHQEYQTDQTQGKKEFDEWLRDKRGYLLTKKLWQNALLVKDSQQSTKAILGVMEFTKAKPKQTIAVESQAAPDVDWDADKIIEFGLKMKGIEMTARDFISVAGRGNS